MPRERERDPWEFVAALVRQRRIDLGMSQRALGTAAGTTDRLVSDIERADRTTYSEAKLRGISRALGWTPDSIERILNGGRPVEEQPAAAPSMDERIAALEAKLDDVTELLGVVAPIEDLYDRLRRDYGWSEEKVAEFEQLRRRGREAAARRKAAARQPDRV